MSGYLVEENLGATVKVHVHGIVIRDVGVDGAGNWSIHIGREFPRRTVPNIEIYQVKSGYPNSATAVFDFNRARAYILLQIK